MTTELKINVENVNLRPVQEGLEDNLKQARQLGRKALLAYAGLWGMAYDGTKALLSNGLRSDGQELPRLLHTAAERGLALEQNFYSQVTALEEQAGLELKKWQERWACRANEVAKTAENRSAALNRAVEEVTETAKAVEAVVEEGLASVVNTLNLPSQEHVAKLTSEIDALSNRIDQHLAKKAAKSQADVTAVLAEATLPLADYASRSVRQVVNQLGKLSSEQLTALRTYEAANDQRVTILKAIDQRLGKLTSA